MTFPFDLFGDPMEYWCFFHNYRERLKSLSDEDLGRLVRCLTEYSATGERTDIPDHLLMAFDFVAVDIDQCHAKAKDLSEKRSKAVSTRWNVQKNTSDTNVSDESICTHTKTNTKTKTKTKDKYGGQNFDQKVVNFSELTNFID